jgi:hypothetical protein
VILANFASSDRTNFYDAIALDRVTPPLLYIAVLRLTLTPALVGCAAAHHLPSSFLILVLNDECLYNQIELENPMHNDYLVHYYKRPGGPFRSLSLLPDEEALQIMRTLADDTIFGARFKDPEWYLSARRQTEQWTRSAFIAKGGTPRVSAPVYMTLGRSPWIEAGGKSDDPYPIMVPLSIFAEGDVSFTYPDSMISRWFETDRPPEYYQPGLHGHVFTRSEILALVEQKGPPEKGWAPDFPPGLAPYIEAQVWNLEPLKNGVDLPVTYPARFP